MIDIDFFQIGFQKCGTTFLDNSVYPKNKHINCIQASNYQELERVLIDRLILLDGLEYDPVQFLDDFSTVSEKYFPAHDNEIVNGLMFESFTFMYESRFDRKNVIDRLYGIWPNTKIIVFIRNQHTWLLSHYSQYIKSGGLLSPYDFIECQLNNPILDAHYIDYYPLIRYLHEKFGKEKVLVCLYEELEASPQSCAERIFSFLDVPTTKINPKPVNKSLSTSSLFIERLINHCMHFDCGSSSYKYPRDVRQARMSRLWKFKHKFIYALFKPLKIRVCEALDNAVNSDKKLVITADQSRRISEQYCVGNRHLSNLLRIDLGQYDYPV